MRSRHLRVTKTMKAWLSRSGQSRRKTMANPFVHIELNTSDHDKAKKFYGELFQWELKDMDMGPMGTYTTISAGEGPGGGMMQHPMPGAPSLWIPYILVDDLASFT